MPWKLAKPDFVGVVFLLLGAFLFILAVPRFMAALVAIPGDAVQFELTRGQPVADDALRLIIENRTAALNWLNDPAYYRDIGTAATLLAFRRGFTDHTSTLLLEKSDVALRSALRLAPVDPGAWARFAYVHRLLGVPPSQVAVDLRASLQTGPYDPGLLESRLRIAIALWSEFEANDRGAFVEQVRMLWRHDSEALARISLNPTAFSVITQAIARDPEALGKLRALRNQLRSE
ncbi:MAG: hypothetical protein ACKVP5_08430 [Aestuariivirga sp.]